MEGLERKSTGKVSSTQTEEQFEPVFSQKGEELIGEMLKCHPQPVLLIGDTGWGKTIMCREATRRIKQDFFALNAHPGMEISMLIGMWRPQNNEHGIEVVWEDGLLTTAIRTGATFLFEELTRAPQEAISRLHGILDSEERYWSVPEAGIKNIPVSDKFWFIATANPHGAGYLAERLDRSLSGRFIARFPVNEPIADEEAILKRILADPDPVERIKRVAVDARMNRDTNIPTRDIVQWAKIIKRGFSLVRAFELAVSPKFEMNKGLLELVRAHAEG